MQRAVARIAASSVWKRNLTPVANAFGASGGGLNNNNHNHRSYPHQHSSIRCFSAARKLDYYQVLGVDRNATAPEIKKAYFALAKKYHPDQNKDDKNAEKKFQEATEAWEVLGDEKKKSVYDQYGHAGLSGAFDSSGEERQGGGFPGGFPGGFGGSQGGAGGNFENIFDMFGGNFQDLLRNGGRPNGQGQDMQVVLNLKLKDILKMTKRDIVFKAYTRCGKCEGNGCEGGKESEKTKCAKCGGNKYIIVNRGGWQVQSECPSCNARGYTIKHTCKECSGSGRTQGVKKVSVDIPPGVDDGMTLRVRGEGSVGENKGPAGDLIVQLVVDNEPGIQRQEADLLTTRRVNLIDTILGGSTEVKTLDGLLDIKVPAGTMHGDKLRIPGKGLPRLQQRGRGDFFVKFDVELPRDLTEKQKQLLKEFQEEEAGKRSGSTFSKSTSTSSTGSTSTTTGDASKKSVFDKIKDVAGF
jgi:molecular chaperone DnaJ